MEDFIHVRPPFACLASGERNLTGRADRVPVFDGRLSVHLLEVGGEIAAVIFEIGEE
jgi:hypothetical protein